MPPSSAKRRKLEAAAAAELAERGTRRVIEFTLYGLPVPKGRPRFGRGKTFTPDKTRDYESSIKSAALLAVMQSRDWPLTAPAYEVEVRAYFPDWKSGDADNVLKAVCDGMEGAAYDKDRRVYDSIARRRLDRKHPRTEVRVEWKPELPAEGIR